jgi:hypothetical protein
MNYIEVFKESQRLEMTALEFIRVADAVHRFVRSGVPPSQQGWTLSQRRIWKLMTDSELPWEPSV